MRTVRQGDAVLRPEVYRIVVKCVAPVQEGSQAHRLVGRQVVAEPNGPKDMLEQLQVPAI